MRYFDYKKAAAEAKIAPKDLRAVEKTVRQDFPEDRMLFELHVLRACRAIASGRVTLQEVLEEPADPARA